jgi:predicted Zn finger-like uncharacterized protein
MIPKRSLRLRERLVLSQKPGVSMKFSCERCQTRYSIGDDKVKGKVLKIRCKTCGNIIVVREQQAVSEGAAALAAVGGGGGAAAAAPASPSPSPSPSPSAAGGSASQAPAGENEIEWFIAIKGKQHGPAKHEEVVSLFREGKITERTHLWHDKMSAWTRLKDLPEFAAVVSEGPAPRRAPPPPPPPPEEASGAEIVNFEAARAQRQGSAPTTPSSTGSAASPSPSAVNDPFAAIQGVSGNANDAPRESTRVFIMQAGLHNRQKKQRMYAGIAALSVLGFVGLCVADYHLDILGLKNVVEVVAEKTGIMDQPIKNEWDDVEGDPILRCQLNPNPSECVKKIVEQRRKQGGGRKKPALPAVGGTLSDEELKRGFDNVADGEAELARRIAQSAGGVDIAVPSMSKDQIKAMFADGKGGPSGPKAKIETPSVAGTTIDAENASKVVREGQAGIQTCVDDAMKNGEDIPPKAQMTLTIQMNGTVSQAVINNAVVQASKLGGCLTRTARKWKFAPTPEAADLVVPLLLR